MVKNTLSSLQQPLNIYVSYLLQLILITELTGRWQYDGASVSRTRTSNNASVCSCHSPQIPKSAIKAVSSFSGSASRTTGSFITSLNARAAISPNESWISLWSLDHQPTTSTT